MVVLIKTIIYNQRMSGHVMSNDYNKVSHVQNISNILYSDILIEYFMLASNLPISQLNVADLGCSTGRNSFLLFQQVSSRYREESSLPVTITHEDQPSNPWDEFFAEFQQVLYTDIPNTFCYTLGKSFYEQLFPDKYIHIAYCSNASHYTRRVINCPDNTMGYLSNDSNIRQLAIKNGKEDLKLILKLRTKEIAPGGFFILNSICQSEKLNSFFEYINDYNSTLIEEGVISREEFERFLVPIYPHSVYDWKEVLDSLSDLYIVRKFEHKETNMGFYNEYLETGDIEKYSRILCGLVKGVAEMSIRKCLLREEDKKQTVVDEYFRRFGEYIRIKPIEFVNSLLSVILEVKETK
jgi:hypothetical protein